MASQTSPIAAIQKRTNVLFKRFRGTKTIEQVEDHIMEQIANSGNVSVEFISKIQLWPKSGTYKRNQLLSGNSEESEALVLKACFGNSTVLELVELVESLPLNLRTHCKRIMFLKLHGKRINKHDLVLIGRIQTYSRENGLVN